MAARTSDAASPDAVKLLAILDMRKSTFAEITDAFRATVADEQHGEAVALLRLVLDVNKTAVVEVDRLTQTLVAFHLLDVIAQSAAKGVRRSPVSNLVRTVQFHELQRLEGMLREDARNAESVKYKASSNTNTNKKQTAKDAIDEDVGRAHLLMKAVIFRQLLGRPGPKSVTELLETTRASLEAEADSWSSTPNTKQQLIEHIAGLKETADSEALLGGIPGRTVVVAGSENDCTITRALAHVDPAWARPRPTTLPLGTAELRPLVASTMPRCLQLDASPHPPEHAAAAALLQTARKEALSAAQHQQLAAASAKHAAFLNLSTAAFLEVSDKNPKTAAALLQLVPSPAVYLDALLSLPNAEGCLRSEVVLAAAKSIQPYQITSFVKALATRARSLTQQQATQQREAVSAMAVTLHQLVGGKADSLSSTDRDIVVPLFNEYAGSVSDIPSLWGSLLKA